MVIGKKSTTICWYHPMITWFQELVLLLDSCNNRTVDNQEMRQIGLQNYDQMTLLPMDWAEKLETI